MAENNAKVTTDKSAVQYIKNKLQSAQWFIHAVQQRESTMLKIMKAIVELQHHYFMTGDINQLKPMILKDLFTEGIANENGQVISNKVIQSAIEEVIETEDKRNPYTDQQLVKILSQKG